MIREIIMQNIKGQVKNQPLTGRDIIVGFNGAGKTTRAQAVGISLLGYVPGCGKLSSETYKLSSSGDMTVGLQTDDFLFTRTFSRKADSISQDLYVVPGQGEKTAKQKEARIMSEVGSLPVMLDFNEFLSLSDAKRREFFFNLAGITADAWSKKGVADHIRRILSAFDADENPDIPTLMKKHLDSVMSLYKADDIQQSIQRMLDTAKEQHSHWREQKQKADSAAQKISEYKNQLATTDRDLDRNKTTLDELHTTYTTICSRIAVAGKRQQAEENRRARIAELQSIIDMIELQMQTDREQHISAESIRADIASYEQDILKIDNGERIRAGQAHIKLLRADIERREAENRKREAEIAVSKGHADVYHRLQDAVFNNQGCCAIDKRISCKNDFTGFIREAESEINAAEVEIQNIKKDILNTQEYITSIRGQLEKAEVKIERLINEERDAARNNEDINSIIKQLQATLAVTVGRDAQLSAALDELSGLENTQPGQVDSNCDSLQTQKVDLEVRISDLKCVIDEQNKTRIRLLDFKNTVIDAREAETNAECWKRIVHALGPSGIQGEIVKSILGPIRQDIQDKLDDMGIERKFFFETASDRGKEVFQFGWHSENGTSGQEPAKPILASKRNFDALSTGEQMILLIALITTIIEGNNPPLKVLMIDNIENLDRDNFRRVLAGLDTAARNMDNVILLGVVQPDPDDCPNWTIWDLNQDKVVPV